MNSHIFLPYSLHRVTLFELIPFIQAPIIGRPLRSPRHAPPLHLPGMWRVDGYLPYLWLVGNGGMGYSYNYNYYYCYSSIPYSPKVGCADEPNACEKRYLEKSGFGGTGCRVTMQSCA